MKTGFSIKHINEQLELGALITNDGDIIPPQTDCLIFPFEIGTGLELIDKSISEDGFFLDMSDSQHLDIIIIKEVLSNATNELVEDKLFPNFAEDGVEYADEGIYTIIAINRSSKTQTSMKICVGSNPILKAHMMSGYSIRELIEKQEQGAVITETGLIIHLPERVEIAPTVDNANIDMQNDDATETNNLLLSDGIEVLITIIVVISIIVFTVLIILFRKKRNPVDANIEQGEENE